MTKPFIKFTYEELVAHNNRDFSNDSYINPEPIKLEMDLIATLIYHYSTQPDSPAVRAKLKELLDREDKLSKDLDDAYNT